MNITADNIFYCINTRTILHPEKHILIFIDWYLPGYKAGGPIQSCANLIAHLKDEFRFSIITRDTDFGETQPYPGINSDTWIVLPDGNRVYYLSPGNLNYRSITSFITKDYSFTYLNSLFSWYFTLIPLIFLRNKKNFPQVILAPRGMLGKGALQLKPFKKKVFLTCSKLMSMYKGIKWHASTANEAEEIRSVFPEAETMTALNLPPKRVLEFTARIKTESNLKLFFLSRISPKKNLLKVFDYLQSLSEKLNEKPSQKFNIEFDIIGPVEDQDYWNLCLVEIKTLAHRPNLKITYRGAIPNSLLSDQLKKYHFMILPTLNENFGHVILDAFAASCPVILSDQTPWQDLRSKGIGWDIPLSDKGSFIAALELVTCMKQEEFNTMSKKAFETASNYYQDKEVVEQNRKLF